jgi:NAD(P)H-dependent FMN reductase
MADLPRILVVHHTPSPALQELLDAVRAGIAEVEGVEALVRPALVASPTEVLEADGYVLGTPANIGYMSGALKHFFDQAFYVCQDATVGRPFGAYVHGGSDTTGAIRAIDSITGGMRWKPVRPAVSIVGTVTAQDREACWELGGLVAATAAGLG